MPGFDPDRYSRQTRFAPLGPAGQEKLASARVAVLGCGALGAVSALALARAGVGFLRLIDRDVPEPSNLPRQPLFDEADVAAGLPKAVAAARHLTRINSALMIEPVVADLTASNALGLLGGVDVIVDGTDNLEARYLAKCAHPNIVRLEDLFENADQFFLVLEFMGGGDLFDYLKSRAFRLTEERAREITL